MTKRFRNDQGSIVIGLMVIMAITLTATTLLALITYQSTALIARQRALEADQAAQNAYTLAIHNLAGVNPTASPFPPAGIPAGASASTWMPTEIPNVTMRWWVETTTPTSRIVVHAEGRSGPASVTTSRIAAYKAVMVYNFATGRWEPQAILPTGSAS